MDVNNKSTLLEAIGTVFLYGFSIAALSWKKVCLNLLRYPLQIQEGLGEDLALCA